MRHRLMAVTCLALVAGIALAGCASSKKSTDTGAGAKSAATATSAADLGGMDALVAAAKKEGKLNVIALPPRLGQLRRAHRRLPEEVRHQDHQTRTPTAPARTRSTPSRPARARTAPPTCSTSAARSRSAAPSRACSPPYKVADLRQDPGRPEGPARRAGTTTTAATSPSAATPSGQDLPDRPSRTCSSPSTRARSRSTATRPSPARPSAACTRRRWPTAAPSTTSSPASTSSRKLKKTGNYNPVESTPATVEKGETPISIDWDYLNAGYADEFKTKGVDWKVAVPSDGQFAAVLLARRSTRTRRTRPPRACGRSTSTAPRARTCWLKGYARPVLMDAP